MKISTKKKQKILEHVLFYLYSKNPEPLFTSYIAQELARDEEYTKKLLLELKERNLVLEIKKNKEGKVYLRRSRWRLSNEAFKRYDSSQKRN